MEIETGKKDVAELFTDLFQPTDTGDEGLLKIASQFSLQATGEQLRGLMLLELCAKILDYDHPDNTIPGWLAKRWLHLKQFNQSAPFIMRALDSISLRKFLGENSIKVNVEK